MQFILGCVHVLRSKVSNYLANLHILVTSCSSHVMTFYSEFYNETAFHFGFLHLHLHLISSVRSLDITPTLKTIQKAKNNNNINK